MTTSTNPTIAWTRLLGTSDRYWAQALTTGTDGAIYISEPETKASALMP